MRTPISLLAIPILAAAFFLAAPNAAAADPAARWWKGNLHTHSLWSDGDDYPEMIADWYKTHGYHFLALSDHNILSDQERWVGIKKNRGGEPAFAKYLARFGPTGVDQREEAGELQVRLKKLSEFRGAFEEPGRFLMIQGEEITDRFLTAPIHINATNLRELIKPQGGRSVAEVMRNNVGAVLEQRKRTGVPMFAHVNHPNFGWALTAEELMQVENEQFFEVYNGHNLVRNEGSDIRAGTERIWDIVLTKRLGSGQPTLYGMANDDSHNYHAGDPTKQSRPGRGWVMVRADTLSAEKIIASMEAGDFYASSGVFLSDVRRRSDAIEIEIEARPGVTYRTEFIGTRKGYDASSEPVLGKEGETLRTTRRYSKDVGAVLAAVEGPVAKYVFKGDEIYVRARVTSSAKKADGSSPGEFERAWTQPVVPGKP